MRKLYIAMAGAVALALIGAARAEDPRNDEVRPDQPQQRDDQNRRDNPQERNDPARQEQYIEGQPADMGGSQQSGSQQQARPDPKTAYPRASVEYSAELKQCDRFDGNLKTQCLEAVMKKFGQM
jgi:hypothetical protein